MTPTMTPHGRLAARPLAGGLAGTLLLSLLLAGCLGQPEEAPETAPAPPAGLVRFLLTGDTGTGSETQYAVARAMEAVCAQRGCDFMIILGDLIYEIGVSDPYDPQFEQKFELPYANLSMPIYAVLGNHDNSYDPATGALGLDAGVGHWYEAGEHMVAYHHRTDRLSDKWQMPARYYSFRAGEAEFFALDSNTMMYENIPVGSTRQAAYEDAMAQGAWFDAAVAASAARWKFTLAHHPYVSNGVHGDAGSYDDAGLGPLGQHALPGLDGRGVKAFFDDHVCASGAIDLHFAGHDHDLQWLKPVESCGATEFIVSGAGAKNRDLEEDPAADSWFGVGGIQGFFWIELVGDTFTGVVYDQDGTVLFQRTLTKTRTPSA
jgi:tartrate-resistant acid phosphatase type 5